MTVTPSRSHGAGAGSGAQAGAEAQAGAHAGAEAQAGAQAGAEAQAGAGTQARARAGAQADVAAGGHGGAAAVSAPSWPPAPRDGSTPAVTRAFLARAALVTAALSLAGAVLGLVRDQALARLFGAGSATDAFLVAWTVPEFAATLLIEDGLAFVLIPAFSAALARRAREARPAPGAPGPSGGDPVRALVAATLPRLTLAFVAVAALLVATAPVLVRALAPGLPDPGLAVDCTRLTAACVLSFGLAGYCSAALRAHRRFVAPAAIYVAYNSGIVTGMLALGGRWGVRSAAAGVAVGGLLMVAVQLPSLLRQLSRQPTEVQAGRDARGRADTVPRPLDLRLIGAVLLFALCRQSQVLVERFLASGLPPGAISHLNYAQKVAQLPVALALMLCTVTFPVIARALAEGDAERARGRVERDLGLVASLALLGTAAVVACAPQIIELLFQRGAFTAHDTAATASVMRVYAFGLLGQTLVGVLIRSYFSTGRATWYPLGAMTVGVVVTAWAGTLAVGPWGAVGIAATNATGITLTAVLLLAGLNVPGGRRTSGGHGGCGGCGNSGCSGISGSFGGSGGSGGSRESDGPDGPETSAGPGGPGSFEGPDGESGPGGPGDLGESGGPGRPEATTGPGGPANPDGPESPSTPNSPGRPEATTGPSRPRDTNRPGDPGSPGGPAYPGSFIPPHAPGSPSTPRGLLSPRTPRCPRTPRRPRRGRHRLPRGVPVGVRRVLGEVGRPVAAAVVATAAGAWAASSAGPGSPLAGLAAGAATVTGVFVLVGRALNAPGLAQALRTVRTVTRRGTHALLRRHP